MFGTLYDNDAVDRPNYISKVKRKKWNERKKPGHDYNFAVGNNNGGIMSEYPISFGSIWFSIWCQAYTTWEYVMTRSNEAISTIEGWAIHSSKYTGREPNHWKTTSQFCVVSTREYTVALVCEFKFSACLDWNHSETDHTITHSMLFAVVIWIRFFSL